MYKLKRREFDISKDTYGLDMMNLIKTLYNNCGIVIGLDRDFENNEYHIYTRFKELPTHTIELINKEFGEITSY
jgi:hypothetical protein